MSHLNHAKKYRKGDQPPVDYMDVVGFVGGADKYDSEILLKKEK